MSLTKSYKKLAAVSQLLQNNYHIIYYFLLLLIGNQQSFVSIICLQTNANLKLDLLSK